MVPGHGFIGSSRFRQGVALSSQGPSGEESISKLTQAAAIGLRTPASWGLLSGGHPDLLEPAPMSLPSRLLQHGHFLYQASKDNLSPGQAG